MISLTNCAVVVEPEPDPAVPPAMVTVCALVIRPGAADPAAPAVYAVETVPVALLASPVVNEFAKLNAPFAVVVTVGMFQSVTAPLAMVLKPPAELSADPPPPTSNVTPDPEIE